MNNIKPLEEMWVVVDKYGNPVSGTISEKKLWSQQAFNKPYTPVYKWEDWEKQGYRCIQVNIQFEEVK